MAHSRASAGSTSRRSSTIPRRTRSPRLPLLPGGGRARSARGSPRLLAHGGGDYGGVDHGESVSQRRRQVRCSGRHAASVDRAMRAVCAGRGMSSPPGCGRVTTHRGKAGRPRLPPRCHARTFQPRLNSRFTGALRMCRSTVHHVDLRRHRRVRREVEEGIPAPMLLVGFSAEHPSSLSTGVSWGRGPATRLASLSLLCASYPSASGARSSWGTSGRSGLPTARGTSSPGRRRAPAVPRPRCAPLAGGELLSIHRLRLRRGHVRGGAERATRHGGRGLPWPLLDGFFLPDSRALFTGRGAAENFRAATSVSSTAWPGRHITGASSCRPPLCGGGVCARPS